MVSQQNTEERPIGIEIIRIVCRHWKIMIALMIVAAMTSIIFTSPFFIDPLYKAETTIYPSTANTSTILLNSDMRFGGETEINNEIQILHSTILRDSIIHKYHLYKHYKIDTTSAKKNYDVNKTYNSNIRIDQSRYNSIVINVYDTDPVMAAGIANDLVVTGDIVKSEIIKKNLKNAYTFISHEFNTKVKELADLGDSINFLTHKNYRDAVALKNEHYLSQKSSVDDLRNSIIKIRNEEGIYDLNNQFNDIYGSFLKANATFLIDSGMVSVMRKRLKENDTALIKREAELEGSRILTARLKEKLDKLNHSGKKYNDLFDNYNFEKGILGELKSQYELTTSSYEKEFPNLKLETLKSKYAAEQFLYNNLKAKYELAFSNLTDQVPSSYIISPAESSLKKASPERLLITVIASLSVFLLTILYFILADRIRHFAVLIKD